MLKLDRRKALVASVAGVAALRLAAAKAATQAPLKAVVSLNGSTYTFSEDQGHDLGDFVSSIGGFTQGCVRATTSGCPLTVFFRPDRTSDRAEVVFELGTLFIGTPVNLGAYSVTISRGATQLATVKVPAHYWFSRWRWQSAPRPLVGNVADLISQNLLPPIGRAVSSSTGGSTTTTGSGSTSTSSGTSSGGSTSSSGTSSTGSTGSSKPMLNTFTQPVSYSGTAVSAGLPDGTFSAAALLPIAATVTSTSKVVPPASVTPTTTTTTPTSTKAIPPGGTASTGTTSTGSTSTGTTSTSGSGTSVSVSAGGSTTTISVGAAFDISSYTAMGLAGVYAYMPTTGERPDIGLVTEPQGQYLSTGAQAALNKVMAQAEAAGSMPWHMRDENTGAPLSFEQHPNATWYPDATGADRIKTTTNPVVLDTAHVPALTYLPYLLTGDPYFLEELQFQSNWDWGAMPTSYRPNIAQARQFAWAMRSLFQVTRQTPATVPSWLLPQRYWYNRSEVIRQWFEANYVNGTRADKAIFRTCTPIDSSQDEGATSPGGTWSAMWQDEFVACVLAWGVLMGFRDWQTSFDWKIGSTIARTNGTSGWIRAQATPYRTILRATATSPFATSWAEGYQLTKQINGITYTNPDTWYPTDMTYLAYTRGALVYAAALGTPGAASCLAWATNQLTARKWDTDYKWQLGTGL